MKVLVVEDEEISAIVLNDNLRDLGYDVTHAHDGLEGWEAFRREPFPILIIDWVMPKLDGVELCRRIRALGRVSYTYVILLTGRSEREDRLEALDAGADDFLIKPVDPGELRARLNGARRVLESEGALRHANEVLQQARKREAELGSEIQRTLLLGNPPDDLEDLDIQSISIASQLVAGDFVEFYPHAGKITDVVAGDVMGKGIPAAMVAAGVKSAIEKSLIRLLGRGALPPPNDILRRVARISVNELIELNTFATLCFARFDIPSSELTYINCGHPQILRWIASEDRCEFLPTSTVPLGFLENDSFPETYVKLGAGDLVMIYSDGITDLQGPHGGPLGKEGFADWLQPIAHLPVAVILQELNSLRDSARAEDDITCIAVRILRQAHENKLTVWSDRDALPQLRQFVRSFAEASRLLTPEEVTELLLGVQEACSNALRHSRPERGVVPISVSISAGDGVVRVQLRYPGCRFDPTSSATRLPDPEQDGGFGLEIIRRSADHISYKCEGCWNILTLEKRGSVL